VCSSRRRRQGVHGSLRRHTLRIVFPITCVRNVAHVILICMILICICAPHYKHTTEQNEMA
jgi:hypothetical protein